MAADGNLCTLIGHCYYCTRGYAVAQWVEATSRKVAGSIPGGVTGIFH